jgi:hypothetical protein
VTGSVASEKRAAALADTAAVATAASVPNPSRRLALPSSRSCELDRRRRGVNAEFSFARGALGQRMTLRECWTGVVGAGSVDMLLVFFSYSVRLRVCLRVTEILLETYGTSTFDHSNRE